ncbi:hypothetical protein [Nitrosomonas communis]|uniref:hypothetical protein n=1 Tax=Nitrosomonas communis TaxID=44574 RepID=UPI003D2B992D
MSDIVELIDGKESLKDKRRGDIKQKTNQEQRRIPFCLRLPVSPLSLLSLG